MYYVYEFFLYKSWQVLGANIPRSRKSPGRQRLGNSLHINQPHYKCPVLHDSMFPRSNPPLIRVFAVVPYIAGKSGAKIELR